MNQRSPWPGVAAGGLGVAGAPYGPLNCPPTGRRARCPFLSGPTAASGQGQLPDGRPDHSGSTCQGGPAWPCAR